ncbi:hypothetical protein TNCT_633371 [Trichonephila clavata]|uniref:Uncharacterized protein n=1 Tax=Trichonephila clavata TaxID=2740835 RepID=A0A8X6LPX8_TRICU|nr:hypothetical protein TNCT_633371 [Trichonephila clavata]
MAVNTTRPETKTSKSTVQFEPGRIPLYGTFLNGTEIAPPLKTHRTPPMQQAQAELRNFWTVMQPAEKRTLVHSVSSSPKLTPENHLMTGGSSQCC